jgi:2-polyprenyl-3-methyl-5-hydroxy-6-metoxy-1,4-benzoquinol methylase
MRRERESFFLSIAEWSLARAGSGPQQPRVLDVGCAYGHLLDLFSQLNCHCTGVELVDELRDRLNSAAKYKVYKDIRDLPASEGNYDVITLIDSLYYFQDPLECLKDLGKRLSKTGVMIIRITNRTPLLNLYRLLSRDRISNRIFGDQVIAFTHTAMQICSRKAGVQIKSVRFYEKKNLSGRGFIEGFLYYRVLPVIATATRLKVTPGLTYLYVRAA